MITPANSNGNAKRVAVVNWTRRHAGGAETYVSAVLDGVTAAGREVGFWAETDTPLDRPALITPAAVEQWCSNGSMRQALDALQRWNPSVLLVNGAVDPAVERQLLTIAPAVFIAHTYHGTCISGTKMFSFPSPRPCSRTFGPACVALFYPRRCGGLSPVTFSANYQLQRQRLNQLGSYGRILTLSEHMRQEYLRQGFVHADVQTLPPYAPADPVTPSDNRQPAVKTLLYLGRIEHLKGCHLLIASLRRVHSALRLPLRVIIAGDGTEKARCEHLAARICSDTLHIEFPGWLEGAARSRALASADVVVLPSLWPEPYGLVGVEAIAAGVPVAAFDTGGIPEWLSDGHGRLAPADPPTPEGLARAIVECARLGKREPHSGHALAANRTRHVMALLAHLDDIVARTAVRTA